MLAKAEAKAENPPLKEDLAAKAEKLHQKEDLAAKAENPHLKENLLQEENQAEVNADVKSIKLY